MKGEKSFRLFNAGILSITVLRDQKWGRPSRGRGRPRVGSDAREGRLRAVVSVAYIWSIADRTVDVFRESMMFPISHASRGLAETAQFQLLPDEPDPCGML